MLKRARAILPILAIGIAASLGVLVTTLQLDTFLNRDLYSYGLQYNLDWYEPYSIYLRLTLALVGVTTITGLFALTYLFAASDALNNAPAASSRKRRSRLASALLSVTFLAMGFVSIYASIEYSITLLTFVGLGLTFWGGLLLYIRGEKYVKQDVLDNTLGSPLAALDQMITELGLKGKGIYLPPNYLKDFRSSRVYIPRKSGMELPPPEEFLNEAKSYFIDPTKGLLFEPPGAALTELFEQVLKTSLVGQDFKYLQRQMPKVLIEDLEVAQDAEITTRDYSCILTLENTVYSATCNKTSKLHNISGSIGCPICSAMACALAKTTGNPITIEREQVNEVNNSIETEYRML
jgi:hypothetical protein